MKTIPLGERATYATSMTAPLFLFLTDLHVTGAGVPLRRNDFKQSFEGIDHDTKEAALALLLDRLTEKLTSDGRRLDAVIFTGDAADRGKLSGHDALVELLLTRLAAVGISAERIVATPGNHDVPRGTAPGSADRYHAFLDAWRARGCVTPWLDGIDAIGTIQPANHRLVADDASWAIYPINSANWSHVNVILPEPLQGFWDDLPNLIAAQDADAAAVLRRQLDELRRFDMARVSEAQLEVFRQIVHTTPQPEHGAQTRLAAIHHHLRTPSLREEVKPFADFTNLELLRRVLRGCGIDAVLHGHKHERAAHVEMVPDEDGSDPRPLLIVSGATLDDARQDDAMRLIELDGLPYVPELQVTPLAVPRGGTELREGTTERFRLWPMTSVADQPVTVSGCDIDIVYHRACVAAAAEASGQTLIVHLDLPASATAGLPADYPLQPSMTRDEGIRWFDELVAWWQQSISQLDARVPYHHGNRLYRFGGHFDQIARVSSLLSRKPSSRAVATLVDPSRDFAAKGDDSEDFASFCLVQFRRRGADTAATVDVIGYYRAQEFARWWPVNVAELRALQQIVTRGTGLRLGRITTITAEARMIGRSPTEVAVPAIDRWLDQHPGRLFLLATCLAGGVAGVVDDRCAAVTRGWFATLEELEAATKVFNRDGVPLAIEGLEALAIYLDALEPKGDIAELVVALRALAGANRAYWRTEKEVADFESWQARSHLPTIRRLSETLLGNAASRSTN